MKRLFRNNCAGCHSAEWVLQNRFDRNGWMAIVTLMERVGIYGDPLRDDSAPVAYIRHYKEELVDYLTKIRGPNPSPLQYKLLSRPRGESAQVVVTEYIVSSNEQMDRLPVEDGLDWTEGVPSAFEARGPHDAEVDPHGMVWIADSQTNPLRTVARLNPKTGEVTNFKMPSERQPGMSMGSHGIAVDPQGQVWFNADGGLGHIDSNQSDLQPERFVPPREMGTWGGTIQVDPQGYVGSSSDGAMRFDPKTKTFIRFDPPYKGGAPMASLRMPRAMPGGPKCPERVLTFWGRATSKPASPYLRRDAGVDLGIFEVFAHEVTVTFKRPTSTPSSGEK